MIRCIPVLAVAICAGCAAFKRCELPPPRCPERVVLTFKGYSGLGDRENVQYYLDGDFLGKGQEAFEKVLNRLEQLPPRSTLIIWWDDYARRGSDYDPPYRDYMITLADLIERKNMTFGEPAGPWTWGAPQRNRRYFTY